MLKALKNLFKPSETWFHYRGAPQVAPVVNNLPANAGDLRGVGLTPQSRMSPGEGTAAHSRILAWRIHGQSLAGYSPYGHKESDTTE